MKICIIAEGSYPYITGGVSSWTHQLINNMSEFEFILITLMPESEKKGAFIYKLPENVVEVREVFLDELLGKEGKEDIKMSFSEEEKEQIKSLLSFSKVNWESLFNILRSNKFKNDNKNIHMSLAFYNLIQEVYQDNYSEISFAEVYWSLRSMYKILLQLLISDYPEADVYHSVSTGYAGLIGSIASFEHGKNFILTEHGIYTREREEEIIKSDWVKNHLKEMWINYFYQISDCAYTRADKVITLFENNRSIQVQIGCPENKIEIIPNGVKVNDFNEVALEVEKRIGKKEINIGAIVRVVPIKDIITMLDAFSLVNKYMENVKFYIMGPTDEDLDYFEECKNYRNYLGLKNVTFTGAVNIKDYLKDMDMLVLTSISEGQPLVILEGLASKLPFISTNVGDYRSLILGEFDDIGPAGRVSNVMDANSIAQDIIELSKNENLRRSYGEAGYKRINDFYTFEKFIERYRDIYKTYGLRD